MNRFSCCCAATIGAVPLAVECTVYSESLPSSSLFLSSLLTRTPPRESNGGLCRSRAGPVAGGPQSSPEQLFCGAPAPSRSPNMHVNCKPLVPLCANMLITAHNQPPFPLHRRCHVAASISASRPALSRSPRDAQQQLGARQPGS